MVRRMLEAGMEGDLDALFALLDPEVAISPTGLVVPGAIYHGHAGTRQLFTQMDRKFPSRRTRLLKVVPHDGRVLAHVAVTPNRDREETSDQVWIYAVRRGRVVRAEGFGSEEAALAAIQRPLPLSVAREFCDAFCQHDADAMAALCDPDVQVFPAGHLAPPNTSFRGRDGLAAAAQLVRGRFRVDDGQPDLRALGDRVLVTARAAPVDGDRSWWIRLMLTVHDGAIRMIEEVADDADEELPPPPPNPPAAAQQGGRVLTPREREIFRLLALGHTGPEIADQLYLSPNTVRTHIQNGVARLGAKTRVQAMALALERGEISA